MVFENGSEQRFLDRGPLDTFVLQYKSVPKADRDALTAFFHTQKGSFDSTWTFYRSDNPSPTNGDFRYGLNSWVLTNDASQGFEAVATTFYSRAGETDALIRNRAVTLAPHQTITANLLSTQTFPYLMNNTGAGSVDLWARMVTTPAFPSALTSQMAFGYFVSNSTQVLGTVAFPQSLSNATNWIPVTSTLPNNPYPTSTQAQFIALFSLTNTSGISVPIPYSSLAFLLTGVRLWNPNGQTELYPACAFEDDTITWTERQSAPRQYDTSLRFRQVTRGGQPTAGTAGAVFPAFGPYPGSISYPFAASGQNSVVRNDLSTGNRVAYAFTGLPGFAGRPLQRWNIMLDTASDDDVGQLETHFLGQAGSYHTFPFVDLDGKFYHSVRYASDSLTITHLQKGLHRASCSLMEVYGPNWSA